MIRIVACAFARAVLMACIFTFAASSAARAGEVADAAARAESLLEEGKTQEALGAFESATDAFWAALPLGFSAAIFADDVRSHGNYAPRTEAKFRAGETALVYLEPVGFGWTAEDDSFKTNLEADVEIRSAKGAIFAQAEKFATFERTSRHKSRELDLRVRIALPQLKPGDYELMLTLRDVAAGKTATAILPFTLVE
jgi:hypothetical protein